ncbi:MAG: hypothetical protein PHX27_00465 [Candidatus ainarchaeum sp.]|nr:hypothetical protein [Candidatus ainarchaeum sp.]
MKGQISIDLILTIIALLIFISSTTIIFGEILNNHKLIAIENELKINTNNYASLIIASEALEDFDYNILVKIKELNFDDQKILPIISFDENYLYLEIKDTNFKTSATIQNKKNIFIENNYLVIKND